MFKVIFIAVLIMFTCVIASAKNDAAVYLKDGTVEQGELVWLQGDKVYLNKNGELWEFEKNEVFLDKTIKANKLDENIAVAPQKPNISSKSNKAITTSKNSETTTYIPPRDSQAYKDYIRDLQQKQYAPPRLSGSRTTGRPYKSDTLETLYKREENCKSAILDQLKIQYGYKNEILDLKSSINISRIHLANPEQFKKHLRQHMLDSIRERIVEQEKMITQLKEMEETVALSIKKLQKIRDDNWAEIQLRKKGH